jgi:hypothetical protein
MHWPGEKQQGARGWFELVTSVSMVVLGIIGIPHAGTMWGMFTGFCGLIGISNALWHFGVLGPDCVERARD